MKIKLLGIKIFNKQIFVNALFAVFLLYFMQSLIYSDRLNYYQQTFNSLFYQKTVSVREATRPEVFHGLIWQAVFMVMIINNFSGVLAYIIPIVMMLAYFSAVMIALHFGYALDVFYASLYGWALEIVSVGYNFISIDNQRKQIRKNFEYYLDSKYIDQISDDPSKLKLGGEAKNITVLFSDIRSFSTISEKLSPEDLVTFMNEFLTPMTNIIMDHQGVVDKYIGDSIMAFWGTPLEDNQHAKNAVALGLKLLQRLVELNLGWQKKGLAEVKIGVGINTDQMIVGNMGSQKRFNYTVMGDGVNLASRLENLTKYYHVPLIISEHTQAIVADGFCLRMLDCVAVKGKSNGVKIYQVMGEKADMNKFYPIIDQTQKALAAYFSEQWDLAIKEFKKLEEMGDQSSLAEIFVARCDFFKNHTPEKNWDGVWQMQEK